MTDEKIPIILCCGANGRAVVYGRVEQTPVKGEPVVLHDARMVLSWSSECGGLLGLAAGGPKGSTRITATVSEVGETVWQEYITVTERAADAIDKWGAA